MPRWCYFLGRIVACVIVAAIAGVATVLAAVLLYHTHLSSSAWLGALAAFVLGGAAWAAAATALSAAIPTTEAAAPTLMLIYFPAIIISGAFGSISEPRWLYTLATYLPAQPLIGAVTSALSHSPGTPLLPVRDVVVLVAWAAAGLATAVAVFRWEPHRPAAAGHRAAKTRRSPRAATLHIAAINEWLRPGFLNALDLAGVLRAQGELGLALLIELRVEHLVIKVGSGLRLKEHACSGCLDDLVVLTRTSHGCEPQRARVFRLRCGGYDPQARHVRSLRG